MEFILPAFLAFLVLSAVLQLFFSYVTGVIARKDGQSDLMQVLAWIPVLQLAPMIVAGGGSVLKFVIGSIGLFVGLIALGIASGFMGGSTGTVIGVMSALFVFALVFIYLGRILWTTAAERDLPGWVGLLCFVPFVGFFVYPYIAVHDGWAPPHGVGLVIGIILAFATTAPSFKMVNQLNQNGDFQAQIEALIAAGGDVSKVPGLAGLQPGSDNPFANGAADPNATDTEPQQSEGASIAALLELNERFELLDRTISAADPTNAAEQSHILDLVTSINGELAAQRDTLDPGTYNALATQLIQVEASVQSASRNTQKKSKKTFMITPSRGDRRDRSNATPAALSFSAAEEIPPAPLRPLPVNAQGDCPIETALHSAHRERGEEEWCQRTGEQGGLRHGWFARYHENGQPESMGEYAEGLRVGVWTRFFESGAVRAQAEFKEGLQDGWMLSFDQEGERLQAIRFDRGAAQK